jgi:hypothetical protein
MPNSFPRQALKKVNPVKDKIWVLKESELKTKYTGYTTRHPNKKAAPAEHPQADIYFLTLFISVSLPESTVFIILIKDDFLLKKSLMNKVSW